MNFGEYGNVRLCLILRYGSQIFLQGLKNNIKMLCQDFGCPGLESNRESLNYETEMLLIQQLHSVQEKSFA
jgi:hypothetical protein